MRQIDKDLLTVCRDYNDVKQVKELIKKGANVNCENDQGVSPLIMASWQGSTSMKVLRYLVEKTNAKINKVDRDGENALHAACKGGRKYICQYLIENGANPFLKNNIGLKPLDMLYVEGNYNKYSKSFFKKNYMASVKQYRSRKKNSFFKKNKDGVFAGVIVTVFAVAFDLFNRFYGVKK